MNTATLTEIRPYILSVAKKYTKQNAEDVTQEVLLKLCSSDVTNNSFLYTVTKNTAINLKKSRAYVQFERLITALIAEIESN